MSVLAAALLLAASAAAPPPLTLDEVLRSVRERAPALAAAQAEREAAGGEALAAEGLFDPSLRARLGAQPVSGYPSVLADIGFEQPIAPLGASVFGGWRLGRGDFPVYDGKLVTNELGELRAGAAVSLWRNRATDRRRTGVERAAANARAAGDAFDAQLIELSRQAAYRYWDWVGAGRRVALATALVGIARDRDRWLEVRVSTGEVPAIDRVDNARGIEQRTQQLASALRARDLAAIELSLFLRDDRGEPVLVAPARMPELPGPVEVDTRHLDVAAALALRPDVRRLEAQLEGARAELAFAENQLAPAVDLTVGISKDMGSPTDADAKRGKAVLETGLLFDVPLQARLLGGRQTAAEGAVARLDALLRLARDRVRADLQDAASALHQARERIDSARRELALALEVEAGERARYELGESNLVFVNLREQQTFETAQREVDALVDHHKAQVQWHTAAGRPAR